MRRTCRRWATTAFGAMALAAAGCNALNGVAELSVEECAGACSDGAPDSATDAPADAPADVASPPFDAGRDAGDAGPDADAGPPPLCDPSDPTLVLCLPFEGNALDGAGAALLPPIVTNVTFGAGRVGQGATFASGGVEFAHAAKLDVDAITMEAFVSPKSLPAVGARMGILDSGGRVGLFLVGTDIYCFGAGSLTGAAVGGVVPIGKFTHIACTSNATMTILYVDGVQLTSSVPTGPIAKPANGVTVGRNDPSGEFFDGTLDELRIYSRVRSPAEIAADANRGP